LAVLLVLAVVLTRVDRDAVIAPAEVVGGDVERYHDHIFAVVKVVDGDTLDIDAPDQGKLWTRIRLWGVDTPEVAGSPKGAMHWGAEASRFAKETLTDRDVRVELLERTRDRYGRLLAYVYETESGHMFNERLVAAGHAYADVRFDHPYMNLFLNRESASRAQQKGLWAKVTIDEMPSWRQKLEK
jgi:micrococcal nuclease